MKITNLTKLIIRFLGGGKIDFPTSNLREVEIEPFDSEGSGGNENAGGFDLDTFKQNIVDTFNKAVGGSITTDNIIMPDAFIIDKNFNFNEPRPFDLVDADLTQFLASYCLGIPNVHPIYLEDSLVDNNSNLYFGIYGTGYALRDRSQFNTRDFDNLPDNSYDGDLNLSNYISLYSSGSI